MFKAFSDNLKRLSSKLVIIWMFETTYVIKVWNVFLVFLFDSLRPINYLSVIKGRVFLGWTSTKLGLICLAQGHNAVTPVRLEPANPLSRVKHSTNEPLWSLVSSKALYQWATAIPGLECDVKNGVNRMMTSECWSRFVCWLLHAQHKNLANLKFSHAL